MSRNFMGVAVLCFIPVGAFADAPKTPVDPAEALIDQLEKVGTQDVGYSGSVSGSSFLPLGYRNSSVIMLSATDPRGPSDALVSLVKLGTKAVPALLKHLDDDRRTKVVIKKNFGGFFGISQDKGEKAQDVEENPQFSAFRNESYAVRVGDLCYVALGQIVNRDYIVVKYIPSGHVSITSVPHSKNLREEAKKQWSGLTEKSHFASLVKDLNDEKEDEQSRSKEITQVGASLRLAYYFPKDYEPIAIEKLKSSTRKFIDTFQYLESEPLDRALCELLAKTTDLQICFALINRLAGRGYDVEIEAFIERLLKIIPDKDRSYVENFRKKLGFNRLHIAVELRSQYLIDSAMKAKLDVNARARDGRTPLHIAAEKDSGSTVQYLLKLKADSNQKDNDGRTPMETAALENNAELVKLLSTVQTVPVGYYSALILGKADRVKEILKAKPELVKMRSKPDSGRKPLEIVAREGHEEIARILLDASADVNGEKDETPPLVWAIWAKEPNFNLIKLLIDRGADVNQSVKGEPSALVWAIREEQPDLKLVKFLIDRGADVNQSVKGEPSALVWATRAEQPDLKLVKLLIDRGADVNWGDGFDKKTPLHDAVEHRNLELVKLLLDAKANPKAKDIFERTPLGIAKENDEQEMIKFLEKAKERK